MGTFPTRHVLTSYTFHPGKKPIGSDKEKYRQIHEEIRKFAKKAAECFDKGETFADAILVSLKLMYQSLSKGGRILELVRRLEAPEISQEVWIEMGDKLETVKKFFALLKHLYVDKDKDECDRISFLLYEASTEHNVLTFDPFHKFLTLWGNVHYDDTAVCDYYILCMEALVAEGEDKGGKVPTL